MSYCQTFDVNDFYLLARVVLAADDGEAAMLLDVVQRAVTAELHNVVALSALQRCVVGRREGGDLQGIATAAGEHEAVAGIDDKALAGVIARQHLANGIALHLGLSNDGREVDVVQFQRAFAVHLPGIDDQGGLLRAAGRANQLQRLGRGCG